MKVGTRVYHFTNRECVATVIRVTPAQPCDDFGMGNWLLGAFMAQPLIIVELPNGVRQEDFASSWLPVDGAQ